MQNCNYITPNTWWVQVAEGQQGFENFAGMMEEVRVAMGARNQLLHAERAVLIRGKSVLAQIAMPAFQPYILPAEHAASGGWLTRLYLDEPSAKEARELFRKQMEQLGGQILKADMCHRPSKYVRDEKGEQCSCLQVSCACG